MAAREPGPEMRHVPAQFRRPAASIHQSFFVRLYLVSEMKGAATAAGARRADSSGEDWPAKPGLLLTASTASKLASLEGQFLKKQNWQRGPMVRRAARWTSQGSLQAL